MNEFINHIVTEYVIGCSAKYCDKEIRATDIGGVLLFAERAGYAVRDGKVFCAKHAELTNEE